MEATITTTYPLHLQAVLANRTYKRLLTGHIYDLRSKKKNKKSPTVALSSHKTVSILNLILSNYVST